MAWSVLSQYYSTSWVSGYQDPLGCQTGLESVIQYSVSILILLSPNRQRPSSLV